MAETLVTVTKKTKQGIYEEILPQIESLVSGEPNLVANLANTAAVLKIAFPDSISWAGFYLLHGKDLVLGPFQGKPACVRIALGKGVCGTAAVRKEGIIVEDVRDFPGHIFCDPESKSEIVIPMLRKGVVVGVLDVDSNEIAAFDTLDQRYLTSVVRLLIPCF